MTNEERPGFQVGDRAEVVGDTAVLKHWLPVGTIVEIVPHRSVKAVTEGWVHCRRPGDPDMSAKWVVERDLKKIPAPNGTAEEVRQHNTRAAVREVTDLLDGSKTMWLVPEASLDVAQNGVERKTSSTGGQKDAKLARYDQIPTLPLRLLAERFGYGNSKYPTKPGELDNWRKGYEWSLSFAALMRHVTAFWGGEDMDPETGQPHLIAAAWHCFVLTTWMYDPDMREKFDDRQDPKMGARG